MELRVVFSDLKRQMRAEGIISSTSKLFKYISSPKGASKQLNTAENIERDGTNGKLLAFQTASQEISSSLDLDDVLYSVTEQMTKFLSTTGCAISEWDPLENTIKQISWYGQQSYGDGSRATLQQIKNHPFIGNVLEKRQNAFMTLSQPGLDPEVRSYMRANRIKSLLMLPMIYHNQVLGLVEIMDENLERKFTTEEIALTQLLANQAAISIENARLHTEMQKRLVEQSALRETGTFLLSTLDTKEVLERIAEQMAKTLAVTSAYILLFEGGNKKVRILAEFITPRARQEEKTADFRESFVLNTHKEFLSKIGAGKTNIVQVNDQNIPVDNRDYMRKFGIKTILYIPLYVKDKLIGYAELWESRYQRTFSKADINICQGITQQAAIAIENARLFYEAQEEIRQRKRAETALRESEERYALAVQGANDGLWDWDLTTNEIYFSQRWKGILGYEIDQIGTHPDEWLNRIHPDDKKNAEVKLYTHLGGLTPKYKNEHRIKHKDGTYRWVLCRGVGIKDEEENIIRMVGSMTDITERKRIEEQLIHNAFHDTLTGLPNRALFLDRLDHSVERIKRLRGYKFSILFIDFDRFKQINDSYGHTTGDRLLKEIANRLKKCIRSVDTIARLGGDEFAALLEDIDDDCDAYLVAERILTEMKVPFILDGHQMFISASVGIVNGNSDYQNADEVLRDADIAMYHAKALGKSRYAGFDPTMRERVVERLQMENDLRTALEGGEFGLVYQPILALNSGNVIGFEALLRWHHPQKGTIMPSDFIHLAEESGLINPIGQWILEEASQQLHKWQQIYPMNPPLSMNVNLSSKQLTQSDFIDQVERIISSDIIVPGSLRLEITESAIMENTTLAARLLKRLKSIGIHIEMDDFGTGYSSLNYLHRFPIGAIKIDRSFISQIDDEENNSNIVRIILNMARDLGLRAVAEGIETHTQLARLRELECQFGQGYLFSGPVEAAVAESFIQVTRDTRNLVKLIDQAKINSM